MSIFAFVVSVSIAVITAHESSEFVTDLSADAFVESAKEGRTILTMFYAPWCGHCKKMMPVYESVCKNIKAEMPEDIICARLDCTTNDDFCRQQNLRGYPTINVARGEAHCEYKGQRTEEELLAWFHNYYNGMADIEDTKSVKKRLGQDYAIVAYLDVEGETRTLVKSIICEISSLNFMTISDPSVAIDLRIPNPNSFNVFSNGTYLTSIANVINADTLLKQVFFVTNPIVPEYTHESVKSVFSNYVFYYLCFIYDNAETLMKYRSELEKFAMTQAPKIRVFTVDGSNEEYKDVLKYFHVSELPQIVFYNDEAQNYNHLSHKEISVSMLSDFADGCINGSVPIFVQRQAVPENWEKEDVKVLVTDTYEKIFEMYESGGIILYYAPWCGHCEALMPTWDKLGSMIASKHPEIFVAKIDHTQNHVGGVEVQGYPTIIAFKADKEKVIFTGDRTFGGLEKFIYTHLLPGQIPEDEEPETDEKVEEKPSQDEL